MNSCSVSFPSDPFLPVVSFDLSSGNSASVFFNYFSLLYTVATNFPILVREKRIIVALFGLAELLSSLVIMIMHSCLFRLRYRLSIKHALTASATQHRALFRTLPILSQFRLVRPLGSGHWIHRFLTRTRASGCLSKMPCPVTLFCLRTCFRKLVRCSCAIFVRLTFHACALFWLRCRSETHSPNGWRRLVRKFGNHDGVELHCVAGHGSYHYVDRACDSISSRVGYDSYRLLFSISTYELLLVRSNDVNNGLRVSARVSDAGSCRCDITAVSREHFRDQRWDVLNSWRDEHCACVCGCT